MGLSERLKQLRREQKKTQEDIASAVGIARTTYASYEQSFREPDYETLQKMADYFEVSTDYLLGRTNGKRDILFGASLQGTGGMHANLIKETMIPYSPDAMVRLPVLGTIRAGVPIDRIEFNEGYTLVDPDLLRGREGFALRVKGDSMVGDRIHEGDIVIVVKQEEVQPHEIAVVAVGNDEATLKRVKQQGDMCMLIPSNTAMTPDLVSCSKIKILGKVVEVKFWPK